MRMNFLALAVITFLMGLMELVRHNVWLGIPAIIMAAVLAVLHFIRVRRFKRFDQSKTFE